MQDLTEIKAQHSIPPELLSCHTAIVDGYVLEGHVPAEEIRRLLSERPDVIGLAVAGMPPASPGMDVEGSENDPFDVIAFYADGTTEVYASYPK
jgi:hypothetical protein